MPPCLTRLAPTPGICQGRAAVGTRDYSAAVESFTKAIDVLEQKPENPMLIAVVAGERGNAHLRLKDYQVGPHDWSADAEYSY
eukprot:9340902-Pyramimonas_sp.AAC.1